MGRRRLLLIDDSATARALLRILLMNEPFDLFEESDPRSALERLSREAFDVVIADFTMPHLTGIELVQIIRASPKPELSWLPIILLTAESEAELEGQAMRAGANCFLRKPVKPETLRTALKQVVPALAR